MKQREPEFVAPDVEHPLVGLLVHDVGQVPELVTLQGFVGRSGRAGFCRVYTDIRMSGHVEVLVEYVRAVAVLPVTEQNPWRPNVVWLEANRLAADRPDSVLVGGALTRVGTRDLAEVWAEFGNRRPGPRQRENDNVGKTNEGGGTGGGASGPTTKFSPP